MNVMFSDGYKFFPKDIELVGFYLYNKILGKSCPLVVPEVDIYSKQPCKIWEQLGGIDGDDLHFFTTLKKKGTQVVRKIDCDNGTWSGDNGTDPIFLSGKQIGVLKRFHYKNGRKRDGCSWIMYEYSINPLVLPPRYKSKHDSYVICKIRRKLVEKKEDKTGRNRRPIATQTLPPTVASHPPPPPPPTRTMAGDVERQPLISHVEPSWPIIEVNASEHIESMAFVQETERIVSAEDERQLEYYVEPAPLQPTIEVNVNLESMPFVEEIERIIPTEDERLQQDYMKLASLLQTTEVNDSADDLESMTFADDLERIVSAEDERKIESYMGLVPAQPTTEVNDEDPEEDLERILSALRRG